MKKDGFTYIELIFSMVIIVVLMITSMPLLTRTKQTEYVGFGEYQCTVKKVGNEYQFYERSRYNTPEFETDFQLASNGCTFYKPIGVTNFNITLIGSGSGGANAWLTDFTNRHSFSYSVILKCTLGDDNCPNDATLKNPFSPSETLNYESDLRIVDGFYTSPLYDGRKFEISGILFSEGQESVEAPVAKGGKPGDVSQFSLSIASMPFDTEGKINFRMCDVASVSDLISTDQICVGKPGPQNSAGYPTYIRIDNPQLSNTPNTFCTTGTNSVRFCYANGGAGVSGTPSSSDYVLNKIPTHNAACMVIPGKEGEVDLRYATESEAGQPAADNGCTITAATDATGIGVGGAGGSYVIKKFVAGSQANFQHLQRIEGVHDTDLRIGSYESRIISGDRVYDDVVLTRADGDGEGSAGGGGAVFISW